MLAHITGRTFREEVNPRTSSYNLVAQIRTRRMRWLGHILRDEATRAERKQHSSLVYQAIWEQHQIGQRDNLLMDAPQGTRSLIKTAKNKSAWRKLDNKISISKTTSGPEINGEPLILPAPRREDHHCWQWFSTRCIFIASNIYVVSVKNAPH